MISNRFDSTDLFRLVWSFLIVSLCLQGGVCCVLSYSLMSFDKLRCFLDKGLQSWLCVLVN